MVEKVVSADILVVAVVPLEAVAAPLLVAVVPLVVVAAHPLVF